MMGMPFETEKSLRETIDFAKELPLTNAHVTFTTPLPGSELYNVASKYGVFDNDWNKMNMWTPVFIPHGLTEKILQKNKKIFFREFYLRPRIIYKYLRLIRSKEQLLKLMSAFWTFLVSLLKSK
jgi:hypothetical protein